MLAEGVFFNRFLTKSLTINPTDRTFTGLLTVETVDKDGEIIVVDELMKVIPVWLNRGAPLSDTHSNRIVGRGTGYRKLTVKDEDGHSYPAVEISGFVFKDYELDNDIWDKMKSGEYTGLSFGGATKSDREPVVLPDGRMAYRLKDLEHYEVALCKSPANELAIFTSINSIAKSKLDINYTKKSDDEICIRCSNVGCYVVKGIIDVTKPFAGYKDFAACTRANSDKGDPEAYCATIMRQVEGTNKISKQLNTAYGGQGGQVTTQDILDENEKERIEVQSMNKDHPVAQQWMGSTFCLQCGEDPYSKDSTLNQDDIPEPIDKGSVEDMTHDKCPHCGYIPMDGKDTVQDHINKEHPNQKVNSYQNFDEVGAEPELLDGTPDSYKRRAGIPTKPDIPNASGELQPKEEKPLPPQTDPKEQREQNVGVKEPKDETYPKAKADVKKLFEYGGIDYDHYGVGRDTTRNEDQNLKPDANTANEDTTITPAEKAKIFNKKEVGYVDSVITKTCGTCEYFRGPDICRLPLDSPVDAVNGCCNFWDPKVKIEKGEDGKAKIKLEGEPAERLLEQAGIIPQVAKAPIRTSGHKQYSDMQPQTGHISVHGSSDTVNDPNPEESPFNIGNVEENNFVGAHTSKSDETPETVCGICGKDRDKHDRDSGHPFKGVVEKSQIESYISWISKGEPEQVPIEDVINWIKVMNPSQLQHAIDPNNWYEWSERVSRLTWDEMNEDQKRLLVATYAFRNDGKVVEGIENESMTPKDEGKPQSQVGNIGKTNLHPQANTSNINATPTPMTVGQNTKNPIDPVEDASTFERTQKALDSLKLTLTEIKIKRLKA